MKRIMLAMAFLLAALLVFTPRLIAQNDPAESGSPGDDQNSEPQQLRQNPGDADQPEQQEASPNDPADNDDNAAEQEGDSARDSDQMNSDDSQSGQAGDQSADQGGSE